MNKFFQKLLPLLMLSLSSGGFAQFYTEDFGVATCATVLSADTFTGSGLGSWSVQTLGPTSQDSANWWFVSARESNTGQGNCGDGCLNTSTLTNRTLHVSTSVPTLDPSASYNKDSITDILVLSEAIDFTGRNDVLLEFDYLHGGDGSLDNAQLYYQIGALTPTLIGDLPKTDTGSCGNAGTWARYSYYFPASFNNLPVVRIGFRWKNDATGSTSTPSFAVDDINLTEAPPSADFGVSALTFCATNSINFFDSTEGNPTSWDWQFGGSASPTSSTAQNPTNISFPIPGTYTVTLTATNNNGNSATTLQVTSIACDPPTPAYSVTNSQLCQGQCIDFFNASTDGSFGQGAWQWFFQGGTPSVSTDENPTGICYSTPGSYDVTLTVTDTVSGKDSTIVFVDSITVGTCSVPVANFASDTNEICNNDTIFFFSLSTGQPSSYLWEFQGGNPAVSTDSAVTVFYPTPGTYTVKLSVTNSAGTDTIEVIDYVTVNNCPKPRPNFTVSSKVGCPGICLVFEDQSKFATDWYWEFPGGNPSTSFAQNPKDICYDSAGIYPVSLTVENVNGDSTLTRAGYIRIDSCLDPDPSYTVERDSICRGSCVKFINTSKRADSIYWVFWWHPYPESTDTLIWNADTNVFSVDTFPLNDFHPYLPDTFKGVDVIYDVQEPILCFDDSGSIGVQLFAVNQYGIDVQNDKDEIILSIGGEHPVADAGPDINILIDNQDYQFFLDRSERLEASGTGPYFSWFPEEELSCYDCPDPIIYTKESRKYYLTNFDDYGCQSYDSVAVYVKNDFYAGVPNIFSPNGDDNNDFFNILGNGISNEGFTMRIWDRYGNLVYETYDINAGWPGTYKGQEAPTGAYNYYVKVSFLDGSVRELSGNLTLVRY